MHEVCTTCNQELRCMCPELHYICPSIALHAHRRCTAHTSVSLWVQPRFLSSVLGQCPMHARLVYDMCIGAVMAQAHLKHTLTQPAIIMHMENKRINNQAHKESIIRPNLLMLFNQLKFLCFIYRSIKLI